MSTDTDILDFTNDDTCAESTPGDYGHYYLDESKGVWSLTYLSDDIKLNAANYIVTEDDKRGLKMLIPAVIKSGSYLECVEYANRYELALEQELSWHDVDNRNAIEAATDKNVWRIEGRVLFLFEVGGTSIDVAWTESSTDELKSIAQDFATRAVLESKGALEIINNTKA